MTAILVGAIAPVFVTAQLAGWLAERNTHDALNLYAAIPLERAENALAQARRSLRDLDGMTGCTPEHIEAMRNEVIQSHYIDEIGYFENGVLACSSWGLAPSGIRAMAIDFTTPDGLAVRGSITSGQARTGPFMSVQLGAHNALIKHIRIIDILNMAQVSFALAYMPPGAPPLLLASGSDAVSAALLAAAPIEDEHQSGTHLSDIVRRGDLVGMAAMPTTVSHRSEQIIYLKRLLPFGLAMAFIIVINVVWLTLRRLDMKHEIGAALRNGEMRMVYQPVIALESGRCVGAEALIRWRRRDGRSISPDIFIPVAEKSKLINKISAFCIQQTCDDLGDLLRANPNAHLSLNLSARDLTAGDIVMQLRDTFVKAGIAPKNVWLEITERSLIDYETSFRKLLALRNAGYKVAIDDFGTGYSSLQYLQNLSLDALKIDKSFVDVIGTQTANRSVIATIIDLAISLKLDIVAEGIETLEQLEFLRERNVQFGQGYFIARPMELAEFLAFYEQWRDGAPVESAHPFMIPTQRLV